MMLLTLLWACNTAPLDYRVGRAPGASAAWWGPTHSACDASGNAVAEYDGFELCEVEAGEAMVPVDDPILVPCSDTLADVRVVSVFDGETARAYAVAPLLGRELLHDDWGDEPLLVDF